MMDSVIDLRETEPGIVQLTMQDKVHKNGFSEALMNGLVQAFETIKNNERFKVVIVTGYENYFASGGTQEALLAIYEGRASFTDVNLYSLAQDCSIPVISAMQGHGIGGGFIFGMFADFIVLSKESIYTTNFMKYGFTPGMGATYILPQKFGVSLAHEMLLTAANYRGAQLEKRGIPYPVLPRNEVLAYAYELARQIADKPLHSLITLKDHLVGPAREQLAAIIKKEVQMHEKTFHHPEVKERIMALFGK
ncbi:polyketide biosynthesis enoyl-CoA hydratase PksI [Chitinophaga niastensis]|uniref:Polyketide biosynthesis enoyl-CoA hydratase PksI n=1 Tax=Chitinophaga niastensis TaxID=536980 RepID=A0A2P8HPQ7_CHINA|nr:polyketide synthase [Chitinophaga niastensis]PSL48199.1 polyketide biosynthesis enoyl-CoA hydratase PksI [Chitinophaga niastensis]